MHTNIRLALTMSTALILSACFDGLQKNEPGVDDDGGSGGSE